MFLGFFWWEQQAGGRSEQNAVFVDILLAKEADTTYSGVVECLQITGQERVIAHLLDISEEMLILSHGREIWIISLILNLSAHARLRF